MPEPLLDTEDLDVLNAALDRLDDSEENITRAEQAGIDVTAVKERMNISRDQIRRIKTAFFPGQ